MHEIVSWGYPHLLLYCGKFIICTWAKMTFNYLLDLRNDIKERYIDIHCKYTGGQTENNLFVSTQEAHTNPAIEDSKRDR